MRDPRTAEQALAWLRAGQLQPIAALDPELRALEQARTLAACFNQFPEVLQYLLEITAFRAPVDYRLPADQAERYALIREGQNQVIATVLELIDLATNERKTDATSQTERLDDAVAGRGRGGGDGEFYDGPGVALR